MTYGPMHSQECGEMRLRHDLECISRIKCYSAKGRAATGVAGRMPLPGRPQASRGRAAMKY